MPHYADGSEAKVGDQVVGKLYNSGPEPKAGVIVSVTPGVETCNAMVQFAEAVPVNGSGTAAAPRMAVRDPRASLSESAELAMLQRTVQGESHGNSGAKFVLFTCADYCATNELTKVG